MSVVGEAIIKLVYDGKSAKVSLNQVESEQKSVLSKIASGAKTAGKVAGTALAVGFAGAKIAIDGVGVAAAKSYSEYEQLAGGMQKIFDEVDFQQISDDAQSAFETMNISASQFMENMAGVGATFAQTMGDATGYETAKAGMQALADYASGTGKSVDTLMEKYQAISRSTSSYLSIADQFAGLLPQTTDGFLKQAQASGYLRKEYKRLNQVPVAEYQEALTKMLGDGVKEMGLAGNTAQETAKTITGSLAGLKSSLRNLVTGLGDPSADLDKLTDNVITQAENVVNNLGKVFERILPALTKVIMKGLPKFLKAIVPVIEEILPDLITAATELLVEIIRFLPQLMPIIVEGLKTLIITLIPYLPEILGALFEALVTTVVQLLAGLGEILGQLFTNIFQGLGSFFESIGAFFGDFANAMANGMNEFVTNIGQGLETIGQWFHDVFQGIWDFVTGIFSGIADFFRGVWDTIAGIFNGIGKAIGDAVSGAFKATVNGILSFIEGFVNTPINILNGFIDAINAAFGFIGVNLGKIGTISLPRMASGGVVTNATTAIIGEAGDEAVIPLERNVDNWAKPLAQAIAEQFNEEGMDSGRPINVYMTNEINNELDADEIGRRIMTSIRRSA